VFLEVSARAISIFFERIVRWLPLRGLKEIQQDGENQQNPKVKKK